jgi:hypothetical protein
VIPKKEATWNLKRMRQQLRKKGRPTRLRARARRSPSKRSMKSSGKRIMMYMEEPTTVQDEVKKDPGKKPEQKKKT